MGLLEKERLDREYAQDAEDRLSRIEARFWDLVVSESQGHTLVNWQTAFAACWKLAEAAEDFLEGKRREINKYELHDIKKGSEG